MGWTAVAAIGQVIGATAVVGTLIYLSIQVRQNTAQSRISASQAVDTSNMQSFEPIYIPENSRILTKGHTTPDKLTEHELEVFKLLMGRIIGGSFNTTSYYHSQGSYDDELYRTLSMFYQTLVFTRGGLMW